MRASKDSTASTLLMMMLRLLSHGMRKYGRAAVVSQQQQSQELCSEIRP